VWEERINGEGTPPLEKAAMRCGWLNSKGLSFIASTSILVGAKLKREILLKPAEFLRSQSGV
jgi:hypothetical protein